MIKENWIGGENQTGYARPLSPFTTKAPYVMLSLWAAEMEPCWLLMQTVIDSCRVSFMVPIAVVVADLSVPVPAPLSLQPFSTPPYFKILLHATPTKISLPCSLSVSLNESFIIYSASVFEIFSPPDLCSLHKYGSLPARSSSPSPPHVKIDSGSCHIFFSFVDY